MSILEEIMADPENAVFTQKGWQPIFSAPATAKIVIIGQAPSRKVQDSGIMWHDASGDRLRAWLGVDEKTFMILVFLVLFRWIFISRVRASLGINHHVPE